MSYQSGHRYSQSYLQSISYPCFFISPEKAPRSRSQSGADANLSSSMQVMAVRKASGSPLRSSSRVLLLRVSSSSLALIMLLADSFIHGSSPFTRKISEYRRLSRSSRRQRVSLELAARLLNRRDPLNLSLNSSGTCFPLRMQGRLSSKSVRQRRWRCLPRPMMKLLGLTSPWTTSLRCRYSMRSTSCSPAMRTVLRVNLPPQRTRRVSRLSPSSSMTRQVRPFSSKASLISGKPCRWGCFNFWQVWISFCMSRRSLSAQLFRKKTVPSWRAHFWTTLYPLSLTTSTALYFPFIIKYLYTHPATHYIHTHMNADSARIYLLMGRFASGKTTLIRRILAQQGQERYAIIQNEFAQGEMGIQQPLIMDESGTPFSSFLQLPNGCICCSAKNDLVAAVEYIVNNTAVRNIVVETNGLADPAASIKQFWFDEEMSINAELHSVITMVSARKWAQSQGEQTFMKQCVFASHILVSFVDVAGEEKYGQIQEELSGMNCECRIGRSDQADLKQILHGDTLFNKDILNDLKGKHLHTHGHASIRPLFVRGQCKLKDKSQVEQCVGELLWERGLKILRIKGVLCLQSSPYVLELQGVEDLFEVKETKASTQIYGKQSRILIIGEDLSLSVIQEVLGMHL